MWFAVTSCVRKCATSDVTGGRVHLDPLIWIDEQQSATVHWVNSSLMANHTHTRWYNMSPLSSLIKAEMSNTQTDVVTFLQDPPTQALPVSIMGGTCFKRSFLYRLLIHLEPVIVLLIYVHSNLVEKILLFPLILYFRRCPHVTASLCLIFTTITYQKPDQIEIETCWLDTFTSKDHVSLNV